MWSKAIVFIAIVGLVWANMAQAYPEGQGQDKGPSGPPSKGPPPSGQPPHDMPPPKNGQEGPNGPPPRGSPPSGSLSTTPSSMG